MTTYSALSRTAAVVAGIALALPAFAATIDVGTSGSASVGSGQASASSDTSANADASTSSDNDDSAMTDDTDTASSTDSDTSASNDRMSGSMNVAGMLSIGRDDVSDADESTDVDPMTVDNDDELNAYARSAVSGDAHLQNVSASEDEVSVSYDESAHLFGIFPMMVTTTATANADGSVSIHYPWYRFLMSTDRDELESSASAEVRAAMTGSDASAGFDAQARARVISALHRAMKARYDANVSATADADASAESSY